MTTCVLYIEDHPNNRLLVKRIVQAEGLTYLEAVDGESGWHVAASQKPDLIFMDLHLPGRLNGLDVTRLIKQHPQLAHIPVIALTAYGSTESEEAALAAGCDAFLRKPADIRQIRAVLHHYLDEPQLIPPDPTAVAVAYI